VVVAGNREEEESDDSENDFGVEVWLDANRVPRAGASIGSNAAPPAPSGWCARTDEL
jgi:hypothetical protein